MNVVTENINSSQKTIVLQRLTALWAFTESGLGGVMHALQIPFTGLLVGGMAVIMISMIAELSEHNYKQILKSALIVLIVKAMVSPHTPFPAYIAVSFQALLGYCLFSLMKVNTISILLLSIIAMLESAVQKLLILTLFLGELLWKAADGLIALLAEQFGFTTINGSYWIIAIYLFIYIAGAVVIALLALRTIKSFHTDKAVAITALISIPDVDSVIKKPVRKNKFKKLWLLIGLMLGLSVLLFFFASNAKQGWLAVLKTISWTLSAILIWYMIIGPLFTKAIQNFLQKKQSRYSNEVLQILSFIPVLRQLTLLAWQHSKLSKGFGRWNSFVSTLIQATLTYTEPPAAK